MRRLLPCAAVLVLVFSPLPAEEPPYKRLLQGEEARKAALLGQRRDRLEKEGKYAEALAVARELLRLCERLQGAGHWETENQRAGVATLETILSLDEEQQQRWTEFQRLSQEAIRLTQQGKYADAGRLSREAAAICEQVLGPRHVVTGRSYGNLGVNLIHQGKYADAEAILRKGLSIWEEKLGPNHPDTATACSNLAHALAAQGKAGETEKLLRRAVAIWEHSCGPDHPQTAIGYNGLGIHLNAHGQLSEAETLLRQALAIRTRTLGLAHPDTSRSINNLASALRAQGNARAAEPLYRQALLLREQRLGADHPDTAAGYGNLAACLGEEGKYAEAEAISRKALELSERSLGQDHPQTARCYHNLSYQLFAQGKYGEAEQLSRKAVELYEHALGPAHPETALANQSLAASLDSQQKHLQAERIIRNAIRVHERTLGQRHSWTATDYNSLAVNLDSQGKHREAELLHRKVLEVRKQVLGPLHPETATACYNLGLSLDSQGKYKEGEVFLRQALSILTQVHGAGHPTLAHFSHGLATNLASQDKKEEAITYYRRAVEASEASRLRLASAAFDRAIAGRTDPYLGLALCLAGLHRAEEAWQAAEAGMSRALLDNLAGAEPLTRHQRERAARLEQINGQLIPLSSLDKPSAEQQEQRDRLVGQRATLLADMDRDAVEQARRRVFSLEQIQSQLGPDTAIVFWLDLRDLNGAPQHLSVHWACVVRSTGPPVWARLTGSAEDRSWTDSDESLAQHYRAALARRSPECSKLAVQLRRQRLEPLLPYLAASDHRPAVKRLLVVPLCGMSGVPLETLTDRYTIGYIPSATIFARLAQKHRGVEQPSLLALGDPAFKEPEAPAPAALPEHGLLIVQVIPESPSARAGIRANDVLLDYDGVSLHTLADFKLRHQGGPAAIHLWRQGKTLAREIPAGKLGLVVHKQPAPAALEEQHERQTLLASSRGPAPRPLPGTRQEVEALARLLPSDRVRLLLGSLASEQQLTDLATTGKLKQYRLLHFATHGAMDPVSPTRSALLLANDRLPDPATQVRQGDRVYTGRLTVGTLLGWRLDADLVTLSACETGLGRQGGGEGFLGFVQALLQVGAHSVVVSLWPVDDAATALLMMRFYENLLGKRPGLKAPLGRADALQEARQWLRGLKRSEAEALTAQLSQGQLRVTVRPLRPPAPPAPDKEEQPYAHPYYWSAFVLLGDPD